MKAAKLAPGQMVLCKSRLFLLPQWQEVCRTTRRLINALSFNVLCAVESRALAFVTSSWLYIYSWSVLRPRKCSCPAFTWPPLFVAGGCSLRLYEPDSLRRSMALADVPDANSQPPLSAAAPAASEMGRALELGLHARSPDSYRPAFCD